MAGVYHGIEYVRYILCAFRAVDDGFSIRFWCSGLFVDCDDGYEVSESGVMFTFLRETEVIWGRGWI